MRRRSAHYWRRVVQADAAWSRLIADIHQLDRQGASRHSGARHRTSQEGVFLHLDEAHSMHAALVGEAEGAAHVPAGVGVGMVGPMVGHPEEFDHEADFRTKRLLHKLKAHNF